MSYWHLNGMTLDQALLTRTIAAVLQRHEARGVTSDVSWALAFCLEHRIELSRVAGQLLSKCDDDCIALQALHCHAEGLIPRGFSSGRIRRLVRNVNLDGEHWLLGYEALRQGFLTESQAAVGSHPLVQRLPAASSYFLPHSASSLRGCRPPRRCPPVDSVPLGWIWCEERSPARDNWRLRNSSKRIELSQKECRNWLAHRCLWPTLWLHCWREILNAVWLMRLMSTSQPAWRRTSSRLLKKSA